MFHAIFYMTTMPICILLSGITLVYTLGWIGLISLIIPISNLFVQGSLS
jgi:hypothetical protein